VPFRALGVNVGSLAQVTDPADEVWEADQPYRAGSFGYVGGKAAMFDKDLAVTGDATTPFFITYRAAIQSYRYDVPDGDYDVELLFAEPSAKPGERVFDVSVNGEPWLDALDLAAEHGLARAARYTKRVSASGGHGVVVSFAPRVGEPILSGIRVVRR
jgi:beta-galactosidase